LVSKINKKTLLDLELTTVLGQIGTYCNSNLSKREVEQIEPFSSKSELIFELKLVNEYLASLQNENKIPNHDFYDVTKEIKLLTIENSYLDADSFLKICKNVITIGNLLKFLKKYHEYFPNHYLLSEKITFESTIITEIQKIISSFAEIENKASLQLYSIRKEIHLVRQKIDQSFSKSLQHYNDLGFLDDIRESLVNHQRALAVKAMYRRKVRGSILGSSKTGSIVYLAPEAILKYDRELQNLLFDEQDEIIKILKDLTCYISPFADTLWKYQEYFIHIDVILAKATYAKQIDACLPKISNEKKIYLKDAFHPILLEKNKCLQKETIPQTLNLNQEQQIIVISGPNAGGKSITLKTIGLLQLMFQSGILIPVHPSSELFIFQNILTDIGDNQSIENQLSTYSYRLKNMRYFLKKCNENTLFLIDEFGTGSDPELGGALAEIFLEEFYTKKAFGIITTHYANLKILADELPNVVNANMQFDSANFQPLYKLNLGQAGSSFTFEVAQKNGIPFSLINRAKKKVQVEKVRLDKTIAKLQKERNKLQKTTELLESEKGLAKKNTEKLSRKHSKIEEKLADFVTLYDNNQKLLNYGRKINELTNRYFQNNNKKLLITNFLKWTDSEHAKFLKKQLQQKPKSTTKQKNKSPKNKEKQLESIEKEVLEKVTKIKKEKEVKDKIEATKKLNYLYKVNDKVRLKDSKSNGIIDSIEKQNVVINYGFFTTKATLNQLELVEAFKKK